MTAMLDPKTKQGWLQTRHRLLKGTNPRTKNHFVKQDNTRYTDDEAQKKIEDMIKMMNKMKELARAAKKL
jgi:hypothetical protein